MHKSYTCHVYTLCYSSPNKWLTCTTQTTQSRSIFLIIHLIYWNFFTDHYVSPSFLPNEMDEIVSSTHIGITVNWQCPHDLVLNWSTFTYHMSCGVHYVMVYTFSGRPRIFIYVGRTFIAKDGQLKFQPLFYYTLCVSSPIARPPSSQAVDCYGCLPLCNGENSPIQKKKPARPGPLIRDPFLTLPFLYFFP